MIDATLVRPSAAAIFVKTPGHSPVKSRLAAGLGQAGAERLHVACARATAAVLPGCAPAPVGYFAVAEPDAAGAWPQLHCIGQGEGALGERLHRVFATLQERHGSALLLGADAPQLDAALVDQALAWLAGRGPRIAFGPAADGGFWLFGASVPIPREAWNAVAYSRPDTGEALLGAVEGLGVLHLLPSLHDLDTVADIAPVAAALQALARRLPEQDAVLDLLREAAAMHAPQLRPQAD